MLILLKRSRMKLQEVIRRIEEVFKEDKVTIYIGSSSHIKMRE
jgi:hypothetical protein